VGVSADAFGRQGLASKLPARMTEPDFWAALYARCGFTREEIAQGVRFETILERLDAWAEREMER
jgi:hypothetical protein